MRKKFVLLTGRHDDAFHRTARGRFASERDATAYAEDARRRGEFDWWMVVELEGGRITESIERPARDAQDPERIATTAELESHGFLIPVDSSASPN